MTVKCKPSQLTLEVPGKVRNKYLARIPVAHSREDVLDPLYFGHVMTNAQLTTGDQIECEWEDFSRTIFLQVRGQVKQTNQLLTKVMWEVEDDEFDMPKGYRLDWRVNGYVILLDDEPLDNGFPYQTREQASVRANILAEKAADQQRTSNAVKKTMKTPAKKAPAKPKAVEAANA